MLQPPQLSCRSSTTSPPQPPPPPCLNSFWSSLDFMVHLFKKFLIQITSLCANPVNWRPFSDLSFAPFAPVPRLLKTNWEHHTKYRLPLTSADPSPQISLMSPLFHSFQWLPLTSPSPGIISCPQPLLPQQVLYLTVYREKKKKKNVSIRKDLSHPPFPTEICLLRMVPSFSHVLKEENC